MDQITCRVCGNGESAGGFTYCQKCFTPHHKDCWEYAKGCSIYGCGALAQSSYKPEMSGAVAISEEPQPVVRESLLWEYLAFCMIVMLCVAVTILSTVVASAAWLSAPAYPSAPVFTPTKTVQHYE